MQILVKGSHDSTYTYPPQWETDTVACCGYSIHVLYPVRTDFIYNPDTVWIVFFDSRGRLPA
ncbi:MAG: hypothetical protein DI628_04225 [Blastochloris viridis]|uniref:Uncharacterized protein n=1 Tax=Blastochloris viridis TaxID=1079 RepID=A0A6N4R505_BLAVI|nr:MAG: hypothetical protein DI628_04225 [Blastochloris viridis]